MSGTAISSTLMVAALDLNLVQLLRAAINTPDSMVAGSAGGAGSRISANSPAQAAQQAVTRSSSYHQSAGARNCDCPAATFHPSHILEWHPRLNAMQPAVRERPMMPVDNRPTIQPPWKVLPWPKVDRVHRLACQIVNPPRVITDISDVGRTLDLFI